MKELLRGTGSFVGFCRRQLPEETARGRCRARCREDCGFLLSKHNEPTSYISRMILSWMNADAKLAAEKGGTKLGNQLFHGVRIVTEPSGKVAIEPLRVSRPMNMLVKENRIESFRCRPCSPVDEVLTIRHVDAVEPFAVVGSVASVVDVGPERLNKAINLLELLGSIFIGLYREGPAVNLLGIEDEGAFDDAPRPFGTFAVFIVWWRLLPLVEDHH